MQPSPKNWPGPRIPTTASFVHGQDRKFDLARLDVVDGIGTVALLEYVLVFFEIMDCLAGAHFGEKIPKR
jgi:hypothetical protein